MNYYVLMFVESDTPAVTTLEEKNLEVDKLQCMFGIDKIEEMPQKNEVLSFSVESKGEPIQILGKVNEVVKSYGGRNAGVIDSCTVICNVDPIEVKYEDDVIWLKRGYSVSNML